MVTSAQSRVKQAVAIRLALVCGVIGPLINIVVLLILGATRPYYNAWQVPDSNLELGEGGWLQITNYLVCGALMLGFTIGLRQVLRTGRGSTWGPILLGLFAISFIGLGIFLPDPVMGYPPGASSTPTVQGIIHNIFGQLQFISLIAASFVMARRDAADPTERGWGWYSVATGLLVAVSDVVFVATVKLLDGGPGPAGLISRLGIVIGWSWIALLAIRLNLIRMGRKIPGMPVE